MKTLNDTATDFSECDSLESLPHSEVLALGKELKKRERIIDETRNGWKAAPTALTEIRDQRLYRAKGFRDFASYCKDEIKLGKSTVNRYIAIGEVDQFLVNVLLTASFAPCILMFVRECSWRTSSFGKPLCKILLQLGVGF